MGRTSTQFIMEHATYRRSNRYYLGLISPGMVEMIIPETAVDFLNNLDWHLFEGSFFNKNTGRSDQKVFNVV